MKKYIKFILIALAVVVIGIKGKGLLSDRKNEIANEALPLVESITAHIVKPSLSKLDNKERYLATVVSDQSIKLSTKLAGFIEKVYVLESDIVKKGQPLVKIDSIELRSNIDALKANLGAQRSDLALSRSIYERNKKLYRVGGLAKEKLDLSRVSLNAKNAGIENTIQKINQANHQLSYLQIKAPFDGVVDALILQEGDLAATGKPILSLSNGEKKLIFSYAPKADSQIEKGKKVLLDGEVIGEVKSIYTTSKNGLVTAEITLNSALSLPIGSSLSIDILTKSAEGCSVSQNSILHKSVGIYVLEYKGSSFSPLLVKEVISDGENIIITPCPKNPIAKESEVKLAKLPAYKKVDVIGVDDE